MWYLTFVFKQSCKTTKYMVLLFLEKFKRNCCLESSGERRWLGGKGREKSISPFRNFEFSTSTCTTNEEEEHSNHSFKNQCIPHSLCGSQYKFSISKLPLTCLLVQGKENNQSWFRMDHSQRQNSVPDNFQVFSFLGRSQFCYCLIPSFNLVDSPSLIFISLEATCKEWKV